MGRGAARLPQKKVDIMLKRESNQNWMKARVCHSLPGRLRLTATGLRFLPDNGRALAEVLARLGGMRRVRVNAAVESVLLEYDPERLDAHAAQEHAEMALARFAIGESLSACTRSANAFSTCGRTPSLWFGSRSKPAAFAFSASVLFAS